MTNNISQSDIFPNHPIYSIPRWPENLFQRPFEKNLQTRAHEVLAELIRDTRLGTSMERATKEEEREGIREARDEGGHEDEMEEDEDEEEWEEDGELVGVEAAPVIPKQALEAAGRWLFNEFGGENGDV
ncbi:hypothetical protein FPQ18DRAFT_376433 [Pyronema domesticum]|nr:hypothetical protein FPQ18DRAFT_376433 [Pyronema domesticum]